MVVLPKSLQFILVVFLLVEFSYEQFIFSNLSKNQMLFPNDKLIQSIQTTDDYIYLSIKEQGIWVYSFNNQDLVAVLQTKQYQDFPIFCINKNNTNIYSILDKSIYILTFSQQDLKTNSFQNINLQTNLKINPKVAFPIQKIILDFSQNNLFVLSQTQVAIYDSLNLSQLAVIDISNKILQMRLSLDQKYLFLLSTSQSQQMIRVFQFKNNQALNEVGQINQQQNIYDFEISNDRMWFYGIDQINCALQIANIQSIYLNQQSIEVISTLQQVWPYSKVSPIVTFKFTKDDKYFMIGLKSLGILVFDTINKLNPQFYYQITFSEYPKFFEFNGQVQNKLLISDFSALIVFKGQNVNLNENIPNLFNLHQQKLIDISQPSRCLSINNGANLIVSQSKQGFSLLKFYDYSQPYNVKEIVQVNSQSLNYEDIIYDASTQTLLGPSSYQSNNLMNSYQINYGDSSQPPQITPTSSIQSSDNIILQYQSASNIQRSKDGRLILQTNGYGFILYDSQKYPELNSTKMNTLFNFTVHQADITRDNKWVICTQRQIGAYGIVSIENLNNITLQNLWQTSGVEGVVTSSIGDYVYLYDGSRGIEILDSYSFPKIKVLSNLKTNSWTSYINLFNNENYLIIASYSTDLVLLVDIKDKQNPFIVSKIKAEFENGNSSCLSQDQNSIYVLNQSGIKYFPLSTKTKIHSQLYVYNDQINQFQEIDSSSFLQIGQLYAVDLTVLYPNQGNKVAQVFYYNNFEKSALPSWISFQSSSNQFQINVQKEGLGKFQDNPPETKQNILLVSVQRQISQQDFVFDQTTNPIQTTPNQSNEIIQQLLQQGLINRDNYLVSSFFETVSNLNLQINGFQSTQLQILNNLVMAKLQQTLELVPITFYIQQSLIMNFQNPQKIINSYSTQATLTLTVDKSFGQFVQMQYQNTISYFSNSQSNLVLEGSVENLNKVLCDKIIFYAYEELFKISVNIIVEDNINYLFNQTIKLSDPRAQFIQQKSDIKLNNPLQQQIENIFPKGMIYLLQSLNIQFNQKSFQASDSSQIRYALFVQTGDQQEGGENQQQNNQFLVDKYLQTQQNQGFYLLSNDDWLQFDSRNLQLTGYVSISLYQQVKTYKLVAYDGYSYAEDTFQLKIQGLPASLILILVLSSFIVLLILIVLFNCRSCVYNFIYQKKVGSTYEEKVVINRFFVKKIAIIGDELNKAQKLLDSIITVMRNNKDQVFFQSQKHQTVSESVKDDISIKKTIKEKNTFFRNQLCSNDAPVQTNSQDDILEQNDKKKQNLIKNFIFNIQNKLDVEKANRRLLQIEDSKQVSNYQMKQGYSISAKIELWVIKKKILAFFTDSLFKNISIDKIWAFLQKHKVCYIYNEQTIVPHQYGLYLEDPTNVFYYCFLSCISEFLLKMDDFSFLVYNLLIELIKLNPKKDKKEWYDRYVKVIQQYPSMTEISSTPFPEVEFNEKLIKSDIDQIFSEEISEFSSQKLTEIKYQLLQNLNFNVIKQVIISQKLGILRIKQSKFQQYFSESSLHIQPIEVSLIKCLIDKSRQKCEKLYKFFFLDKQEYTLQKNVNFLWLKLDVRNTNCLILYGTPSFYEQQGLQIRIYNKFKQIISQFDIKIGTHQDLRLDSNSSMSKIQQNTQQQMNSRQKVLSNFSPSSISQNQNHSPIPSIKKLSFNIEENTIYNYQSQRTKSAFQRLQSNQQSPNINDKFVERKKITLQRVHLNNSFDEHYTCETNEDYKPIIMYGTHLKKAKINDFS